jgi:hypothetical protein
MAVVTLNINIPDDQLDRMRAGLRGYWGKIEDPPGSGNMRDLTNAELAERLRTELIGNIKQFVKTAEIRQAQNALKNISEIDAS